MQRLVVCLVCVAVFIPRFVTALELGPIETRSSLYEPLDARIPVQGAQSDDLKGLNVVLGSPAQFELAGVARLQHLNLLRFVVVEQDGGGGYIHVHTDEPIIEPTLTFLVDVDWPRGRTVRGYRLHLTPAAESEGAPSRGGSAASQAQPDPDTVASNATPAPSGMAYGPVRRTETLWSIAARLRPDNSVSVQRMMLAILEANPNAFEFSNVNALNAGSTLRIPTRDEIGPDSLNAAIAEVQRHHAAWTRYRNEGRATPTPPAPDDSETEPSGRIEIVSPEPATTPGQEDGAQVATLRGELALAMEEADAGRRENDALKLRLAEAEDHIKELNRLVELKNEEIAALRSELHELALAAPQEVAEPDRAEPRPAAAPEGETRPVPEPEEAESTPPPVPETQEAKPALAPAEAEPPPVPETQEAKPALAPAEAEPISVPAPAEAESATAASEPKSLPFGLGSLPVNPVFLVGGAGLLLILLGVVALLRRRRASTGEEDVDEELVLAADESSPPGEDNLLLELEAVAAELSDEPDDLQRAGRSRAPLAAAAGAAGAAMQSEAEQRGAAESLPEDIVEERIAELWQDDRAIDRGPGGEIEADDDSSEITFDIDALTADDSDLKLGGDDVSDDLDIGDLADLADLAAERESEPERSTGEAAGNLELLFSRHEAEGADSDTRATDAGELTGFDDAGELIELDDAGELTGLDDVRELTEFDSGVFDEEPGDASSAAPDQEDSLVADIDGAATFAGEVDFESTAPADRSVDADSIPDDDAAGPPMWLDESTDGDGSEAVSLEDFGEDEVQTKIDLAQVYMEMGDTESARGFLEAALAEGDPHQREAARDMLSKLD